MAILLVALAGGLLAGTLLGGSLANLEQLSLRLAWLVPIALGLQIVAFSPVGHGLPSVVVVTMHITSYGLLLACVAANLRRLPVVCLGVGVFCNAITIVVNGGYMPASRAALRLAGLPVAAQPHNNSVLAGSGAHLAFMGDVFAVPHAVPLANIFSVGDILIAIGLAWLVAAGMRQSAASAGQPVAVGPSPSRRPSCFAARAAGRPLPTAGSCGPTLPITALRFPATGSRRSGSSRESWPSRSNSRHDTARAGRAPRRAPERRFGGGAGQLR